MFLSKTHAVAWTALAIGISSPAWANGEIINIQSIHQSINSKTILAQANPRAERKFISDFVAGVVTGCMRSAKPSQVTDQRKYCLCYANAFAKRYTAEQLYAVNSAASSSQSAPRVINIMMAPEAAQCKR